MHFGQIPQPFSSKVISIIPWNILGYVFQKSYLVVLLFLIFSSAEAQQKTVATALDGISNAQDLVSQADTLVTKIDTAVNRVQRNSFYKTVVDGKSASFPFGILPDNGDENYALIVNRVQMDPVMGMTAEIFMKIPFRSGESLYFMADKVPLSRSGKLSGDFNLVLLKSVSFKIGNGYSLSIKGLDAESSGLDSTFVSFNCKGFRELTLNGSLDFDENTVRSFEEEGPGQPVSLKFYLTARSFSSFILEFYDIPALQFKSLPGFKCTVDTVILDQSEIRNAPEFTLPKWYIDSLSADGKKQPPVAALWNGVYIPTVTIQIPKSFSEGSGSDENVTVQSRHLIVDEYGISSLTRVAGSNGIINGDLKGFKYSVDSLRINIIANRLSQAGFYGQMAFPICKENSTVDFGLTIMRSMQDDHLTYLGYAHMHTKLYAKALGAAQLTVTDAALDFRYSNKQFFPKVDINGSLVVSPAKKGESETAGFMGLEFTGLRISSEAPYIGMAPDGSIKILAEGSNSKMGKLPVSIREPKFISSNGGQRLGLNMRLLVHLQKSNGNDSESGNGFHGEANFTIWTQRNAATKKFGYDGFDLNSIEVAIDQGSFQLKGRLDLFNGDTVYGKGFCGQVDVTIIDKINVSTSAIFGKVTKDTESAVSTIVEAYETGGEILVESNVETGQTSEGSALYRYWFVDGQVQFSPGIPIMSGVELNTFTGGLYYNMQMVKESSENTNVDCKTVTGRRYEPNDAYFGVIAGIGVQSAGGGTVFNGKINFGIELNKKGGINKIATWGGVGFLNLDFEAPQLATVAEKMSGEPVGDEAPSQATAALADINGNVKAAWYVEYDFPNTTLVGDFDIYVDVAGVVKGIDNGKAGHISIYSAPGSWYVYIGRPVQKDMIGLDVFNLVEIGGYMCFGKTLPNPPIAPMPPEINPDINIDYSLLSMGSGLSFGARLSIRGNPGLRLGLCNAKAEVRFIVLTGFDILLSQSSRPVACGNISDRGINRWYATGQAYLYGEAGLNISYSCKVFGSNDFELFKLFLSSFVFAQLPHPTYFKGSVTVGFSALSKDFQKTFSIEKGDICEAGQQLDNQVNFIEAITPADSTTDVPIGQTVTVYFSNPIEEFEYSIQGQQNASEVYRAFVDESCVSITSGGNSSQFSFEFSNDMKTLTLTPTHAYPGGAFVTVTVTVRTQVKRSADNWENTGNTETKSITFKTVVDPGYIPKKDILYAYPLPDMDNFYRNETTQGYIRLNVIPGRADDLAPGYEFNMAIFEGQNEIDRSRSVTYNASYAQNNFTFEIPTFRLENGKKYTLKIMKSPIPDYTDQSSSQTENTTVGYLDPGSADTVIVSYDFTTSKYASFNEKMAVYGTSFSESFSGVIAADLSITDLKKSGADAFEPMSTEEMDGYVNGGIRYCAPLIQFGNVTYDSPSVNTLQSIASSIKSVDLTIRNAQKNYTLATDIIADVNSTLKRVNMSCLINGGCSASELQTILIPKGNMILRVGYYPPGMTTPTSTYNVSVHIRDNIILPQ